MTGSQFSIHGSWHRPVVLNLRSFSIRSVLAASLAASTALTGVCAEPRAPDVRYEPTPMNVVQLMLWLADTSSGDVVYDLGCGDGRIVIAAARRFGARGVCVDIDPARIAESRENARRAGVFDRIRFVNEDLFTAEIGEATVVTLFLSPWLNLKLRARLLRELKPGTRVVSHWHDMGEWKPELTVHAEASGRDRPVYLWIVPPR